MVWQVMYNKYLLYLLGDIYRTRANKGRANYSKNIFKTLDAAIYQERPLIKKYFSS